MIYIVLLICFTCNICLAIPSSEIALGGVVPGMTQERVKEIYGEPTKAERFYPKKHAESYDRSYTDIWTYGSSFVIYFIPYNGGSVELIITSANNGIKTPPGFGVGSNVSDVIAYYGKPFLKTSDSIWYKTAEGYDLVFMYAKGKVSEIRTGFQAD